MSKINFQTVANLFRFADFRTKGGRDKSPARKLLRLESLEERQLLSANPTTPLELQSETLIVDTTSDVVDANDGFLSLREAIAATPESTANLNGEIPEAPKNLLFRDFETAVKDGKTYGTCASVWSAQTAPVGGNIYYEIQYNHPTPEHSGLDDWYYTWDLNKNGEIDNGESRTLSNDVKRDCSALGAGSYKYKVRAVQVIDSDAGEIALDSTTLEGSKKYPVKGIMISDWSETQGFTINDLNSLPETPTEPKNLSGVVSGVSGARKLVFQWTDAENDRKFILEHNEDGGKTWDILTTTTEKSYVIWETDGAIDFDKSNEFRICAVEEGTRLFSGWSRLPDAASLIVTSTADTNTNGTLRYALTKATTGDTITFAADLSGQSIVLTTGQLNITNGITIDASMLSDGITINANSNSRVFNISGGTEANPVQLQNLTVTGGHLDYGGNSSCYGSGIYSSGILAMTNCTVTGNYANLRTSGFSTCGGGIYSSGTLIMMNCSVLSNIVENYNGNSSGGGIYSSGTFMLTNCTVSGNSVSSMSGMYFKSASSYGGGISGGGTLTNCVIFGNSVTASASYSYSKGGGISGSGTLRNCVVSGNSTSCSNSHGNISNGGGIYGRGTLINCTVAGNFASKGGGIDGGGSLTNSIVAMNYNDDISGGVMSLRNSLVEYGAQFVVAPLFDGSGKLTNAESLDLRLASSCWAINAGTNDVVAEGAVDLDGNPRIYDSTVDLGAYEYQAPSPSRDGVSLIVTTEKDLLDAFDGKTSLREAIFNANDGETVTFDPSLSGKTVTLSGHELCIGVEITIDASMLSDGITIDANKLSRVFNIFAGTKENPAQLKNITINGGKITNDNGGGIHNSGVLTLTNCTVAGNSVSSYGYCGGGIYNSGDLTLTNCMIARNSASSYGSYGGGIYNSGVLTLTNCTVARNSASKDGSGNGGGIYNSGGLTLTNCTVVRNYACGNSLSSKSGGGGIFNTSGMKLYNTIVATNWCHYGYEDINYDDDGSNNLIGYDSSLPLFKDAANGDYSLAANSQALDKGDNAYAVYPDGTAIEVDLAGKPRIFNVRVDLGAYEYMPVIYTVTTELDVVDPNDGVLSLREAIAQADSGEAVTFAPSLAGKTIVLNGSQLVVKQGITIDGPTAGIAIDAGGKSSVLSVSGGTSSSPVRLNNLTLTGGKTAWYGGLLYTKDVVSVQNCKFNAGFAYYGGAIANEGTLTVAGSEFNDNRGSHGGAIFNRSTGMLTLSGITATSNSVTNYGGVLYNNGTATVTDSEFQRNSSKNRAGAIYVAAGTVSVAGSTFVDNTAANFGGAVYNAGTFDVSTSSITDGSAIYGGAIANFKTLTVTSCDLTNNSATKQGGAIYHSSSIAVNITAGSISGNSAYQGGGLYVRIGTVKLTGTELKSNSVTHNGGAIYSRNQTILTDCVVTDNFAKYYGGGVYNEKILRVRGTTTVADNSTETGKSQDIHTKDGGQIIYDSELADSVFDETDDWLIEL